MRKKLNLLLIVLSCLASSQSFAATPSFVELFAVSEQTTAQLNSLVAGSRGLLSRDSDVRDSRYFVLSASEGSGIVQRFTYLYVCEKVLTCRLTAMHHSVNAAVLVTYDEISSQFLFSEGAKTVMRVAARLPNKN